MSQLQEMRDSAINLPGIADIAESAKREALDHGMIEDRSDWTIRDEAAQVVAALLDLTHNMAVAPPGATYDQFVEGASNHPGAAPLVKLAGGDLETLRPLTIEADPSSDPLAALLGLAPTAVSANRMAVAYTIADALAYLFEGNAIDMLNSLADLPTTDDEHDDYRSPFDPDTDPEDYPF